MIHGLGRTVRAEDPLIQLTTLDVSGGSTEATVESVETILEQLGRPQVFHHVESEFIERNGLIHINRIQPDDQVNAVASETFQSSEPINQSLHDSPNMIRLRCERVGTTDSLIYSEVAPYELPLDDNKVEVEVYAAGLNYKDVVITMGIVPENEHILGLEGAGIVRRLGKNVHNVRKLEIGQRVLVFKKGSFCNRVHAEAERVYPIPESMTFEETCTLASSYLTGIHSLFNLADTKKGSKVLIHSASGGLGLACIQLCQYIGAEVFATCGNQEKRDFLVKHAGVPADHIFNSRDISFGAEIMALTNGYGVDTILNSLTGDLLDESWRCIAAEGTMVELGKRDMLDRKGLSMEPFGRNASYRCFDMGHDIVSDAMINDLLKRLFVLLEAGHVKPVPVAATFGWDDVPGAMRYMRSANHIGKVVITSGDKAVNVPVRPSRLPLQLGSNVGYLLIGGLKGLCGSVAVNLAGLGAKHVVVMARSGYDDEVSQRVIADLAALGCAVTLGQGDVSKPDDVRRVIEQSPVPIGGVIQGAMVLRVCIF
jgi:NADPH:quinone reductase-like Zn-dependent oxidoreductase